MTNQEKIKYLKQYKTNELEIIKLNEEIATISNMAFKITSSLSDMPKANSSEDKLQVAVEKLVSLQNNLADKILENINFRIHIENIIDNLAEKRLRLLMRYRYIDGLTWENIAVKLNYDYRWVLRLHGIALSKLVIKE